MIKAMAAWLKDLLASPSGHADEARAVYIGLMIFYVFVWFVWLVHGNMQAWPRNVTAFVGGAVGISAGFGVTVRARGGN